VVSAILGLLSSEGVVSVCSCSIVDNCKHLTLFMTLDRHCCNVDDNFTSSHCRPLCGVFIYHFMFMPYYMYRLVTMCSTRSSATTVAPRNAMCQLKSCQLLHNFVGNNFCNKSRTNRSNGIRGLVLTVVGVIHKLTIGEFVDHTNIRMTCCGEVF